MQCLNWIFSLTLECIIDLFLRKKLLWILQIISLLLAHCDSSTIFDDLRISNDGAKQPIGRQTGLENF